MIGILVVGIVIKLTSNDPSSPPAAAISPEQAALNKERAELEDARFKSTVRVLASIRAALREPESVKWADVQANKDGSVVCVTYRAKNGFGGVNVENATFASEMLNKSVTAWNKNCVGKSLYNMKSAVYGLAS